MRERERIGREAGRGRAGFTLIEVITVAVIIAILAAIAFPAIGTIRRNALRKRARIEAQGLVAAVKEYRSIYGKWPLQIQDERDGVYWDASQARLLAAMLPPVRSDTPNPENPRNQAFIELQDESVSNGVYIDPWNHGYVIAVDENEDGNTSIDLAGVQMDGVRMAFDEKGSVSVSNVSRETVAVISWGPSPSNIEQRVYSWTE